MSNAHAPHGSVPGSESSGNNRPPRRWEGWETLAALVIGAALMWLLIQNLGALQSAPVANDGRSNAVKWVLGMVVSVMAAAALLLPQNPSLWSGPWRPRLLRAGVGAALIALNLSGLSALRQDAAQNARHLNMLGDLPQVTLHARIGSPGSANVSLELSAREAACMLRGLAAGPRTDAGRHPALRAAIPVRAATPASEQDRAVTQQAAQMITDRNEQWACSRTGGAA